MSIKPTRMVQLIYQDQSEILAYNIEGNRKMKSKGSSPKPVAQPEYGTVYKHQGMLLWNLHRCYLYIVIRLPKLKDLEQKIPNFPDCDNYSICRSSHLNLTSDDVKLNDNALHQQICTRLKVDYLEKMDIIKQTKNELYKRLMGHYQLFYQIKLFKHQRGQ